MENSRTIKFVEHIKELHQQLVQQSKEQKSKRGSDEPKKNDTLSELVGLIISSQKFKTEEVKQILTNLGDKIIQDIRNIAAESECEMEKAWCNRFIKQASSSNGWTFDNLEEFWYFQNYLDLAQKEINLFMTKNASEGNYFEKCSKDSENPEIIFAGSGALPLSAIIMSKLTGCSITLLDMDEEAANLSEKLVNKLNLPITVKRGNAQTFDYTGYKIVFIASLIPEKEICFKQASNYKVPFVATRGADGLSELLYEDVNINQLTEHLSSLESEVCTSKKLPSDDKNINSTYLFDRRQREKSLSPNPVKMKDIYPHPLNWVINQCKIL